MSETAKANRTEARWPAILTVASVVCLLALMPNRISLLPAWVPFVLGVVVLVPITIAGLNTDRGLWKKLERIITILFSLVVGVGSLVNLANLISAMVRRPAEISGIHLLASSISVWITNVLVFSLLYWQLDRGGPGARVTKNRVKPDWLFPQEGAPEKDVQLDWQPTYVDYLFLGFSTATAFSPTDALPLTSRAKILMMIESSISLVTIVMVASRAINILGN